MFFKFERNDKENYCNKIAEQKMKNKNPDLQKLGDRLKKLRVKKGFISVEKFAFDNELSRSLYSNYENGKGNITYRNLFKVTKALGISLKDFFSEGFY